jgi:glycosyltransferase involved in cell wall biosynthesis
MSAAEPGRPLVSVVMAAKNYARFLPQAVGSVRAQTMSDWELLIVDDGSTDGTPAAIRPFLSDGRVRYFRSDRLGQSRAKNLGVGLSRGRFVAFLDADDAWQPSKLHKQLALFEGRPELAVVFCRRTLIDESGHPLPVPPAPSPPQPPRGRVLAELLVRNFVCFSSAVVRRDVLSHVGRFDPDWDLAIDYDLWLRVARFYEFDFVDEELVYYRTGHGNLSRKLLDRVDTALSIMRRAEERYGVAAVVPGPRVAEAYASTYRTLGHVLRASEPARAVRCYLRALRWPAGRGLSLKGLVAALAAWLSGRRRPPTAAENAAVNR